MQMNDEQKTSDPNELPTPVWTAADAAEIFRQAEYTLHAAVQHAQQLTQRLHDRGDISAAAVCDARAAVMFRAAMVAAAMTQDALREAAQPTPEPTV